MDGENASEYRLWMIVTRLVISDEVDITGHSEKLGGGVRTGILR